MLTCVDTAQLVANAKGSSGLAVRRLAADAGVAGSTVTRIQAGTVDPTVETLQRILDAAGFDLRVDAVRRGGSRRPQLGDLVDAWTRRDGRPRLAWTRWRAWLDKLALHPELTPEAIYVAPGPAGDRIIDALLAAVAEKLADDAGLPRPSWTGHAPALDEPYSPPVVRSTGVRHVPAQLAARGLMIDEQSLWRARETIGV